MSGTASKGFIGFGTATSAISAQILSISLGGVKVDWKDISHMGSPDGWKEKAPAMADGGNVKFECLFDKTSFSAVMGMVRGTPASYTVTWTDGGVFTFSGGVSDISNATPIDDKVTASITFEISGKPTMA